MEPINISVIIPTLNAEKYLALMVEKIRAQVQPVDEIIVIDSASTDQTTVVASKLGVKLMQIEEGKFDHGATRNLAAAKSVGEILVFMTQDALPANSETIGELIAPLKENNIIVSYARQIAGKKTSLSDQYLRLSNYPPLAQLKTEECIPELGIRTFQNSNVCAAYRRKEFEELGQFPAPAVCNEDMIFAARAIFAGYGVYYNARAIVYHTHDLNVKELFRRYFDIGASLDLEKRIRYVGKTEARGLEFLKGQIAFLKERRRVGAIPRSFLEAAAKFAGYKMGEKHKLIPPRLKKYMGANSLYWQRVE